MLNVIASSIAETWQGIFRGETSLDAGKFDLGKPDYSKPDVGNPDDNKPAVGKPDASKTNVGK